MLSKRALENKAVIAYLNAVGGQDELVFDGGSLIVDRAGEIIVRGRQFEEEMLIADVTIDGSISGRQAVSCASGQFIRERKFTRRLF